MCVCVCVRACVRACVRVCVCVLLRRKKGMSYTVHSKVVHFKKDFEALVHACV